MLQLTRSSKNRFMNWVNPAAPRFAGGCFVFSLVQKLCLSGNNLFICVAIIVPLSNVRPPKRCCCSWTATISNKLWRNDDMSMRHATNPWRNFLWIIQINACGSSLVFFLYLLYLFGSTNHSIEHDSIRWFFSCVEGFFSIIFYIFLCNFFTTMNT